MARTGAPKDLLTAIEAGEIAPIYVLHGAERYLIDRVVRALRRAIVGDESAVPTGLNYDVFDLKESGLATAVATARTLPMLSRVRLVIGRGIDLVKAEAMQPLLTYVDDPSPSTCLVLLTDKADKVDGRLKAFARIRKAGYLHELGRLSDRELPSWVAAEARLRKVTLTPDAAQTLAEAAGPDLGRLAQAIEQLALFASGGADAGAKPGKDPVVTAEDVELMIPESRQRQIYELTRAISKRDILGATRLVSTMFRSGEMPARSMALRLQGSLLFQLRRIWRARELLADGTSPRDLASALGVPPFAVDELLAPARRMSTAELAGQFDRLYRADRALKSARIDPQVFITRLVRDLCGSPAGN